MCVNESDSHMFILLRLQRVPLVPSDRVYLIHRSKFDDPII